MRQPSTKRWRDSSLQCSLSSRVRFVPLADGLSNLSIHPVLRQKRRFDNSPSRSANPQHRTSVAAASRSQRWHTWTPNGALRSDNLVAQSRSGNTLLQADLCGSRDLPLIELGANLPSRSAGPRTGRPANLRTSLTISQSHLGFRKTISRITASKPQAMNATAINCNRSKATI